MYRFILKRLLMLIPVLLGVSFIVYTILSFTPGDPVQMMLGDNYSEESYAAMQEELGLDDPFLVQYGRFIINAVHGDFGTSYSTGNPVAAEIAARLPNTILLSACAMLFAILIGIPLGVISATHQYSAVDNISMVGALFGVSMPNFWLGLMLIVIFAAGLGWFPSSNFETWGALVLPAVTLSANSLAMITRMTRSSMLETIRQDYIRTARAKGLKESVITIRHALRNAMIPIVTTVGLQFGFSLGGAVLVETVFSWPGIGRLLVDCIGLKDTPVVVACVTSLRGVGPWTAEMLLIFGLRRPDVVSWGDLAILRGMRMLYRKRSIDQRTFQRLQKRYSPYGTTASLYLWAIACGALPELTDPGAGRKPDKKRGRHT